MARRSVPLQDLARAREILAVLIRHGFGSALGQLPKQLLPRKDEPDPDSGETAGASGPERALRVIAELGPTFVKLGQILSTRPDILPADYVDALASLQDNVPPFPGAEAEFIVSQELRQPIEDLFDDFDPEPVASASIAQVHRARLHDGSDVAVKVQRPDIEERIRSDIHILFRLAEALEGTLEDVGMYPPTAIIQEFERAVSSELDFLQEAHNAEVFHRNLAVVEGVAVPKIHRRFSSHRVLTLQWLDGVKLADAEGVDSQAFMDRVVEATYQQVFVDGFFHADPHPGNLLVDADGTLCYVDFGLVGQLTRSQQEQLIDLFVAIIFKDAETVARVCYRAGGSSERLDLRQFAREADELFARYADLSMAEQPMGTILTDLVQLTARHRLRLPEEYAMLARAGVTLDGIARLHVAEWNMFETLKPFALKLATRRHDPSRMSADALSLANQAMIAARDLPLQLDQIMMDLERGKLTLATRNESIDDLVHAVRRMGTSLLLAVGASAALVSAAVLTAGTEANVFGFDFMKFISALAIVTSLGVASGLVSTLMFHMVLTGRIRSRVLNRLVSLLLRRGNK